MTDTPWTIDRIMQTPKKEVMAAIKRGEGPPTAFLVELVARSLADCVDPEEGAVDQTSRI